MTIEEERSVTSDAILQNQMIDQIDMLIGDDYYLNDDSELPIDSGWIGDGSEEDWNPPSDDDYNDASFGIDSPSYNGTVEMEINPMVNFYRESLIDTIVAPDGSTLVIDNPQANATDEPFPAFDTQKDLPNIDKIYKDGGSSKRRMRPLSPRERRKRQAYMLSGFDNDDEVLGVSLENMDEGIDSPISVIATSEDYSDLRITFYTGTINNSTDSSSFPLLDNRLIPDILDIWSDKLSVVQVSGNLTLSGSTCGDLVTIPPEHNAVGIADTDLIVYIVTEFCNESAEDGDSLILSYGAPCEYDQFYRPTAGKRLT